jgi:hypothetical protein
MSKAVLHLNLKEVTKISKLAMGLDPKSKQLPRQAMEKLSNVSNQVVGLGRGKPGTPDSIASYINQDLSKAMLSGVSAIHAVFKTGVQGAKSPPGTVADVPVSWQPLSKDWINHKRKASKNLLWKNRGTLEKGFRGFAMAYNRRLKSEAYFEIKSERKVYGKPFIYRLTFRLPAHPRFNVLNTVLAESFLNAEDFSDRPLTSTTAEDEGYTDTVIGFLEGKGSGSSRHRPFISKLMKLKGQVFQNDLMNRVRAADAKVNKRRGLTFGLKS